jgi:ankyrin repeat protein
MLHFQQHQTWPPELHLSADDSQHMSSSNLTESRSFHENLAPPYLDPNGGLGFAANQNLHEVISHGTEEEITNLLSSGISVNTRDALNNSPLHTAISRGDIGIVKSLLNYGANVDATGFKGKTALHLAVNSNRILKLLLKHQPALQIQDDEGNTVLHYMLLIKDWWDLDVRETMKTMLSFGADVNITNKIGESPLHRLVANITSSSWYSYMDMVFEFLNHEPDVRSPMRNGSTLFVVFLDNSNILSKDEPLKVEFQCMEKFLMAGADSNIILHSSPLLHYYLKYGNIREGGSWKPFLSLLLQTAKLEEVGPLGDYPLHLILSRWCYSSGQKQAISTITACLIAQNANVNQINRAGAAPLETWLANTSGNRPDLIEVTLLLIKAGASTTTFTSTGKTLFDLVTDLPDFYGIALIKALLEGDISSLYDDTDIAARPEWVGVWRRAWQQRLWRLVRLRFVELEQSPSLPKNAKFGECAFLVIAVHHLKRHMAKLKLWQTGDLGKESVKEDYEEYCAILRDCRERNAEVDPSWYKWLLDLMDFT